ncbi:MAG: thiolase family protein [Opitutaceae bacterium]
MIYSEPIFIVDARRTAIGRFGGALRALSPVELALPVGRALVPDELRPAIGQVVLGQMLPAGGGMNGARQLALRLGLREETTAFTVNMACASGLKAVLLAADRLAAGAGDLALAGGVESMTRAPHYAPDVRWGRKLGDGALIDALTADGLSDPVLGLAMGETAERVAALLGIYREEQDGHALESHRRAVAARAELAREIVPVQGADGLLAADEAPRSDTSAEKLARLAPVFRSDGTVTAGNASSLADGAALVLLANEENRARHGLKARARIVGAVEVGCDPATMGLGPVAAIRRLLAETGWARESVDHFEINEAFSAQVLGCARQLGLDAARLNTRGGAVALGHPLGASGARVLVTLLHTLEDRGARRGIAALCVGGGMGVAVAIERM